VIIIPIPFSFSLLIICFISLIIKGSIPAKGSSRSMNLGSDTSALEISSLLLSPPERDEAF
jgi:hypothetical protein